MTDPRVLNDLLARYHGWCKGYSPVPVCKAAPAFRSAKTSRGFDTIDEVIADELDGDTMEALDFHIGEMPDDPPKAYRSAIYVLARNYYTGRSVWSSPRLPADPMERGSVVWEARRMLTRRLIEAGVIPAG